MSTLQISELQFLRHTVSSSALLTVTEAARLLGGRNAAQWIRQHVSLRKGAREAPLVLWGDVVSATAQHTRPELTGWDDVDLAEL